MTSIRERLDQAATDATYASSKFVEVLQGDANTTVDVDGQPVDSVTKQVSAKIEEIAGNTAAAAQSADQAAASAASAANSASEASASASSAAISRAQAAQSETNAAASQSQAANSAATATSRANAASNSATTASSAASTATTKAGEALNSANAAAASAASAASSYQQFSNRYYGARASDPATRPDGTACQAGDKYFNTTINNTKIFGNTGWQVETVVSVTGANVTVNPPAAAATADTAQKVIDALRTGAFTAVGTAAGQVMPVGAFNGPTGSQFFFHSGIIPSQPVAEAGADNTTPMTPLRVRQAMNFFGLGTAKTLANSVNLNTVVDSGFYRLSQTNPNLPPGCAFGQMIVSRGFDTIVQLAWDHTGTHFQWRSGNPPQVGGGGSWSSWRTVYHSGNFNPDGKANTSGSYPSLAVGSATSAGNADTVDGYHAASLWRTDQSWEWGDNFNGGFILPNGRMFQHGLTLCNFNNNNTVTPVNFTAAFPQGPTSVQATILYDEPRNISMNAITDNWSPTGFNLRTYSNNGFSAYVAWSARGR